MNLDSIDRKILETIEALSTISGVRSRRGVHPNEVIEKLKLSNRDYADHIEGLKIRGFLQVSTGWVAVLTSEGRRVLQESSKSQIIAVENATSGLLEKIWEYISNEYKSSPVKTVASSLLIVTIIYSFLFSVFNNEATPSDKQINISMPNLASEIPDGSIITSTNFENTNNDTLPKGFYIEYNGRGDNYQVVTNNTAYSGSKSLQLWGMNGWGANVHYCFDNPHNGLIGYEVMVKANPKDGCWVNFVNPEGGTWGWGWSSVWFDNNGYIEAPGGYKKPITGEKWYKVNAAMDVETGSCWIWLDDQLISNGTIWLNDQLIISGTTPVAEGMVNPEAYKGIRCVCLGDNSWEENPGTPAYFDDFKFWMKP